MLASGDRRGAFAAMVRSAGSAPAALERAPLWYVKLMLRVFIRDDHWQQIEPLLETALPEREQVGALSLTRDPALGLLLPDSSDHEPSRSRGRAGLILPLGAATQGEGL
jgi:hypothetical protein